MKVFTNNITKIESHHNRQISSIFVLRRTYQYRIEYLSFE